jgi:hypothetical protein
MHLLKNFGNGGGSSTSKPGQSTTAVKSNYFSSLNLAYKLINSDHKIQINKKKQSKRQILIKSRGLQKDLYLRSLL